MCLTGTYKLTESSQLDELITPDCTNDHAGWQFLLRRGNSPFSVNNDPVAPAKRVTGNHRAGRNNKIER